MKQLYLILTLAFGVTFAASAAQDQKSDAIDNGQQKCRIVKSQSTTPAPLKIKVAKLAAPKADIPEGMARVTLAAGDVWQDGSGYQMLLDADHNAYGSIIPENGGLTSSGDVSDEIYAEFEYKIPENADGALATTNIIINSSATIDIPAGIYDFCITNPTVGDRMWIAATNASGNVGGREDDFEFKEGASYVFTVSLMGNNDGVTLEIDDPNAPLAPETINVNPAETSAEVAWGDTNGATAWNIKYRKFIPEDKRNLFCDFEDADQLNDWMIYDADDDGYNWSYATSNFNAHSGSCCLVSASYGNGAALTPDNWLISPLVKLGGSVSFWYVGQYTSYPSEVFRVYVLPGEEINSIDDFEALSEDITATAEYQQYEGDLSKYEGKGYIAIRHYNVTDQWYLNIDDFFVGNPDGEEVPDWSFAERVAANPYTLENLLPDTEYELGIQSIKDDEISDWSNIIRFTTGQSGVAGVAADKKADNVWFNLLGVRLNGKPSQAGVYINNGKKILVK